MRVWIAQCLCPKRHAIMATAVEAEDETAAADAGSWLREQVEKAIRQGPINPWCGICRAPSETWRYELGRTRFTSMAEAQPELDKCQAEQAVTRAILGGSAGRA